MFGQSLEDVIDDLALHMVEVAVSQRVEEVCHWVFP